MSAAFDVAVVGAGAAGLSVAYGAARLGLSVALIERGEMGGECLNTGCIPSKALLQAVRQGADWYTAKTRIKAAIAQIAPVDSVERYTGLGCTVITGSARLRADNSIAVDDRVIRPRRVVLATGSRPRVPAFCQGTDYLTSETIWDLRARPRALVILGAGPVGCEMAEAFARLGTEVTLIGTLLPREARALVAPIRAALAALGVRLEPARAIGMEGRVLILADGLKIPFGDLLLAAGREVDVTGLGVAATRAGIRTDRRLRVAGRWNVYAVGDCADPKNVGPQRFTHVASAHASVVLKQIAFRIPARITSEPPVRVVYTSPELAQVGYPNGARILEHPFAENDRAIAEGNTAGLTRLVLDRKGRLIGAGITGPNAGEMIGLYALALSQGMKLRALAGLTLPYPTRSEAGKRAAGGYFAPALFGPRTRKLVSLLNRLP